MSDFIRLRNFIEGEIISASKVNALIHNIVWLQNRVPRSTPFALGNWEYRDTEDVRFYVTHRSRYLHVQFIIAHDDADSVDIVYGGTTIYSNGTPTQATYTLDLDLNSLAPGLVVGSDYTLTIEYVGDANSTITINYLYESDGATPGAAAISWTTPPNFVGSAVLDAADMNILVDDIAALYSVVRTLPSEQFNQATFNTTTNEVAAHFRIVHRYQYLHVQFIIAHDISESVDIEYNGTNIYSDASPAEGTHTLSLDLDASPGGLTVGDEYLVKFLTQQKDNSETVLKHIYEDATP